MIETAIMGFGTIGSGVAKVLEENSEQISRAVPEGMHVKYILDIRDFPDSPFGDRVVHDLDTILADPEIKVICETMGGKEPAFTFTRKALERGISVCSSNKELVEAFGPELLKIAREHNCSYLFEASVGGGIPLIRPMLQALTQEKIKSISGILNGTTNYILTRMEQDGACYEDVLKEAQELGYAERNPAADVEGHDTGRKIAILSSLATGKTVRYADTYVEGITRISQEDFAYAKALNCRIHLLGMASLEGDCPEVMTAPFLVPHSHPLAPIEDVFNGVCIHGNMVGNVMFYGRGAGSLPTASAVVSDMIEAAVNAGKTVPVDWSEETVTVQSKEQMTHAFLVRAADESVQAVSERLAAEIEGEVCVPEAEGEAGFITKPMSDQDLYSRLEGLDGVKNVIRFFEA